MKRLAPLLAFLLACAANNSEAPEEADVQDNTSSGEHRLGGYDETIIVGESTGKVSIIHVGDTFSKKDITTSQDRGPRVVHSHDSKFYALYSSGTLLTIDPDAAKVEKEIKLPVAEPLDVDLDTGWVTAPSDGKVVKVDLETGKELASIDLASARSEGGAIQPRHVIKVGDQLFVQIARDGANGREENGALAVIDTKKDALTKVIPLPGLEPDRPMVFDAKRNKIFVSLLGARPRDTGALVRIDPETLTVHDSLKAQAGFQGTVVTHEPFADLFIIYHTSTPTTSSHLFPAKLKEDGKIEPYEGEGTLVDAFDGTDALAINPRGTLVAMANTCVTGFCVAGAGVSFIDARTRTVLPKLLADKIGYEPGFVTFR